MKGKTKIIALAGFGLLLMSLNPSREYKQTPDLYGMEYQELKIPTPDGATLYGWFFPAPKESKRYIIISDDGEGNMADNLELVSLFQSAGYNVITYDYRGFGKSSDFKIDNRVYIYPQFVKDLEAVIKFSRRRFPTVKFDLYGRGIGAGISIGVACNRNDIVKVIADAPFLKLQDIKQRYMKYKGQEVIIPFGYNKKYEPYYAIEEPPTALKGILVIVGENDKVIGPEDIKKWQKEVKPAKKLVELYIVPGVDNAQTFEKDKDAYFNKIREFLADRD